MDNNLEIRFMRNGEFKQVRDLIIGLQTLQKMKVCPRLPTVQDVEKDFSHIDDKTGEIIANKHSTYVAVAVDKSKEDDSNIVGYIIYGHAFSIREGPHFWLSSFFIKDEYRKRGLGKKLMEFVRVHGVSIGCERIDVPTMNNNVNGNAFYDKYFATYVNEEYQMMMKTI